MRIYFTLLLIPLFYNAWGQTNITSYDTPPTYPGGEKALFSYIEKNLEIPKKAKEDGVVYVELTISEKGRIINREVLRSTNKVLEQNALDVFKYMPHWAPAKKSGKPYEEKVVVPVEFTLEK